MFEKGLNDMIRGLRANKSDEKQYVHSCIEDIRKETQSSSIQIKSLAVSKLNYLFMLGYNFEWANFNVIEVMANSEPKYKRIGYLAASQTFDLETDVLMLATNLIKKDLCSSDYRIVSIALNGFIRLMSNDLGRDLLLDVVALLSHSRNIIKRKAVITIFSGYQINPSLAQLVLPKLKSKLEEDSEVMNTCINVICEISDKQNEEFMSLVPKFYEILNTSSNNWTLIKTTKLLSSLTHNEPRLIKKLAMPLINIIQNCTASSLLYEVVYTVIVGGFLNKNNGLKPEIVEKLSTLCMDKIRSFIRDNDPNLKYVSLLAIEKLCDQKSDLIHDLYPDILNCIKYKDLSIQTRALNIIDYFINKTNLVEVVETLVGQLTDNMKIENNNAAQKKEYQIQGSPTVPIDSERSYRELISNKIIKLSRKNNFQFVTDFKWLLDTLLEIVHVSNVDVSYSLNNIFIDMIIKIQQIRPYCLNLLKRIINDPQILNTANPMPNSNVVYSAAFLLGEYSDLVFDIDSDFYSSLLKNIHGFPHDTKCVMITSLCKTLITEIKKIFGKDINFDKNNFVHKSNKILNQIKELDFDNILSTRLNMLQKILQYFSDETLDSQQFENITDSLYYIFKNDPLIPISNKAQTKIAFPDELNTFYEKNKPNKKPKAMDFEKFQLFRRTENKDRALDTKVEKSYPSEKADLEDIESIPILQLSDTEVPLKYNKDSLELNHYTIEEEKVPEGVYISDNSDNSVGKNKNLTDIFSQSNNKTNVHNETKETSIKKIETKKRSSKKKKSTKKKEKKLIEFEENFNNPIKKEQKSEKLDLLEDYNDLENNNNLLEFNKLLSKSLVTFNDQKELVLQNEIIELDHQIIRQKENKAELMLKIRNRSIMEISNIEIRFNESDVQLDFLELNNTLKLGFVSIKNRESIEENICMKFSEEHPDSISGNICFNTEIEKHVIPFVINIPPCFWFTLDSSITSDMFLDVISENKTILCCSSKLTKAIKMENISDKKECSLIFTAFVKFVAKNILEMNVVEIALGNAASLHAKVYSEEHHVVGLMKLKNYSNKHIEIAIELKSFGHEIVDGAIQLVDQFFETIYSCSTLHNA